MKDCPTLISSFQLRGLWYFLLSAVLILGGCSRSTRLEEHSSQSITVPDSPKVVIENFQGIIDIFTHNQDTVLVDVKKIATNATRARASAVLKDIEVTLSQENDTITVIARRLHEVSEGMSEAHLTVWVPAGSWINVMSGIGDVSFHGELPGGEHSFQSGSGNISLAIPETLNFHLNALTGNGKISSEIPINGSGEEVDHMLIGTSGENPQISITLTTSNGDITIHQGK